MRNQRFFFSMTRDKKTLLRTSITRGIHYKAPSCNGPDVAVLPNNVGSGRSGTIKKSALEMAFKMATGEPKSVHPNRSINTRQKIRSGVVSGGEDDAKPLKVFLKQARIHTRVCFVGEASICIFCTCEETRAQEQVRAAQEVQQQMEDKLANGLCEQELQNILQHPQDQETHTKRWRWVHREIARLRAQVVELQGGHGWTIFGAGRLSRFQRRQSPPLIRTRHGLRGIRVGVGSSEDRRNSIQFALPFPILILLIPLKLSKP